MPDDAVPGPTRLDRTIMYESRWVNLYRDAVVMPNGHRFAAYHMLEFGRGSVVVLVENAAGQILMEQVTRYPTGMTTWELPAGGIEENESVEEAAEREVREETGYETRAHQEVYCYHPLNSLSNMRVWVVHCRAGQQRGRVDPTEVAAIKWFEKAAIQGMIARREITDGLALIGLLLHWNMTTGEDAG